jgi:hypothetical protein
MGGRILQEEDQGFGLLPPKGRQAFQGILPLPDFIAGVAQIYGVAAVGLLYLQGGDAVIPNAAGGILLGQGVQGVIPAVPRLVGIGGVAAVSPPDQIGHILLHPGAVVSVQQDMIGIRLHLVGCMAGVQRKNPLLLIDNNHNFEPLCAVVAAAGACLRKLYAIFPADARGNRREKATKSIGGACGGL